MRVIFFVYLYKYGIIFSLHSIKPFQNCDFKEIGSKICAFFNDFQEFNLALTVLNPQIRAIFTMTFFLLMFHHLILVDIYATQTHLAHAE